MSDEERDIAIAEMRKMANEIIKKDSKLLDMLAKH
jgi:hypothetical protein